jgi:hypothetical protein
MDHSILTIQNLKSVQAKYKGVQQLEIDRKTCPD